MERPDECENGDCTNKPQEAVPVEGWRSIWLCGDCIDKAEEYAEELQDEKAYITVTERKTYEVPKKEVPDWFETQAEKENWFKNQALVNSGYADLVQSSLVTLRIEDEVKGNETGGDS